jgi:hypothetical protein
MMSSRRKSPDHPAPAKYAHFRCGVILRIMGVERQNGKGDEALWEKGQPT